MRKRALAGYVVAWLLLAVSLSGAFFLSSQANTSIAGHDSVLRPTVDGWVTMHTGPFVPDVRRESGHPVGVDIVLGKTEATSVEAAVERYALLASQPDAQVAHVRRIMLDLFRDSLLRGALAATVPLLLWAAVGRARRRELLHRGRQHTVLVATGAALAVGAGVLAWEPWEDQGPLFAAGRWQPVEEYVPAVQMPDEAAGLQVSGDLTASASRRLIASAVSTYRQSRDFYAAVVKRAAALELRQPEDGETVAVLVSDRHDNVGMDPVARAIGDQVGATAVLNAGDDTSTGGEWEAFSLDSLHAAFDDLDRRYTVSGNHDHGGFVRSYLAERDWTVAEGEPVEGPGGGLLLGFDDPRSSGLGNWRDVDGTTVADVAERAADVACESEERVNTLLVHDADVGTEALARGCIDLVLSGHLHSMVGPEQVVGSNGRVGHAYTIGTTGGAAYALAVGSKLRRPAMVTLVTYDEDGRPVGLQPVTIRTTGQVVAGEFRVLDRDLRAASDVQGERGPGTPR